VPETFRALRHRNFQLYFGGRCPRRRHLMQIIAQGWLVYRLSHSNGRWDRRLCLGHPGPHRLALGRRHRRPGLQA
jgi:hypothetical protein